MIFFIYKFLATNISSDEIKLRLFVTNISQCAEHHHTFCTKNDDYPREYMQQVLQRHFDQFETFFEGHFKVSETKHPIEQIESSRSANRASATKEKSRLSMPTSIIRTEEKETFRSNTDYKHSSSPAPTTDDDDEIELCETIEKVIYPTSATSETGVGHFIFNSDDHKQGVHVSICQSVGKTCDDYVILRNNYRSECKQAKIYRELLSLSPDGKPIAERFEFPASCNCVLKRMKLN